MKLSFITNWKIKEKNIEVVLYNKKFVLSPFELYRGLMNVQEWQYLKNSSSFGVMLVKLIAKADDNNKEKIASAFPERLVAYLMWFWKFSDDKEKTFSDDDSFFKYWFNKLGGIDD